MTPALNMLIVSEQFSVMVHRASSMCTAVLIHTIPHLSKPPAGNQPFPAARARQHSRCPPASVILSALSGTMWKSMFESANVTAMPGQYSAYAETHKPCDRCWMCNKTVPSTCCVACEVSRSSPPGESGLQMVLMSTIRYHMLSPGCVCTA